MAHGRHSMARTLWLTSWPATNLGWQVHDDNLDRAADFSYVERRLDRLPTERRTVLSLDQSPNLNIQNHEFKHYA